jgi:hypothetical protein
VRLRRGLSLAAASLALLGLQGGTSARGDDASLFGYAMDATATSISFLYNQPSFGVPTDPTFELRKVYSRATLDSGPSSHGLASILWPGDVIGNAPPSLAFDTIVFNPTKITQLGDVLQQFKDAASKATEGRSGYPVRGEAFYPSDKPTDSVDLATARMDATALENRAIASSTTGGIGLPGVISIGTLRSSSTSVVEKGNAVAHSVSVLGDVDLFGMIHADEIITSAGATSDGNKGSTDGLVQIVGLSIKDQAGNATPIVVDKDGFHVKDQTQDPVGAQARDLFAKYLEPHGISLSLGAPIPLIEGAAASVVESGLTVHLDARGMNVLLDSLPPVALPGGVVVDLKQWLKNPTSGPLKPLFGGPLPGPYPDGLLSPTVAGFLATMFQGDQDMNIVFGSAAVSSVASPALPPIELPPVVNGPPILGGGGPIPGGFTGGGTTPTTPTVTPGTRPLAITPVGVAGIPAGLLALALFLALVGSGGFRRFADRLFAAPVAARCPLEDER